ncbi:MAG TPA: class I SAM-dependent methyltransferase [Xanthobacteraceae bacterium]|jgi:SAM-dependent methyltransferase
MHDIAPSDNNGTLWGDGICTVCGADEFVDFLEIEGIPAQDGVLWPTQAQAAIAPKGNITLSLCLNCSFAGNRTFEPELLKFTGYNVSAEYSPLYQKFIKDLATDLIDRHGIRNKTVLDIGCGNGYFLRTICALGENRGVGFDPSYTDLSANSGKSPDTRFIQDYYSERYASYHGDLVCCRQVIDHLGSPKAFLKMVRRAIGERNGTVVYFEVPNPERRLQKFAPWKVGYEHGSWFFPESFRLFFELCGFEVKSVAPVHSGDYLGIESVAAPRAAVNAKPVSKTVAARLADDLKSLSSRFEREVSEWNQRLERMTNDGVRAIPWGAGEHGIGFVNILNIQQQMPFIVDINPSRVGKYLPGTGQKVVAPEFMVEYKPDLLIITNPTYKTEIEDHTRKLGVRCDFLVL